jgi:energy-coupling factor transporter ATP-binding protein EcfA2
MSSILPKPRKNASLLGSSHVGPFDEWTVKHDFYGCVLDWLIHRLELVTHPSIFIILGPTGIGKSTMIRHLQLELIKRTKARMEENPSTIPYLNGEAEYTPGVGLDWRSLFAEMLASGNEFLIDAKVDSPTDRPGATLPALRRAVHNMMLYREPALAIIDEASELIETSTKTGLAKNANYLKSLGNRSKTHFAFFGDYRLADLFKVSGQLTRRCYWAHLPPYPVSHFDHFKEVVAAFEKRGREFGLEIELQSSAEHLFAGSCGCVGLLYKWLGEAIVQASEQKVGINHPLLLKTAFPDSEVALWRQDIADGQKIGAALSRRTGRVFQP